MKKIWILNHYAGFMFLSHGGRHYSLAQYLKDQDFEPVVFCSNFDHFTHRNCVEETSSFCERTEPDTGVPYVFLKTREYSGNGFGRILNMTDYYRGVLKLAKKYAREHGAPDIIYASSVHPLALIAGLKIAKRFGVRCLCEVRDLWPESIVAYSARWKRSSLLMRLLYAGEKRIYKKADRVIMTWAGGYDYIRDRGWDAEIPELKVVHISNGVDLAEFEKNRKDHPYSDPDLSDPAYLNFIYTGSVRTVNDLSVLVGAAKKLGESGHGNLRIIVFGDGDQLEILRGKAAEEGITNIIFKGRVGKEFIPSILSQAYALILQNKSTSLDKYGQSQNKFFEYLAARKPILMTYSVGHSVVEKYRCGVELDSQDADSIADAIVFLSSLEKEEYDGYCGRAGECAETFDYRSLCDKLVSEINSLRR